MTFRFTRTARREVVDATAWYQAFAQTLAQSFQQELDEALQRIGETPDFYPIFQGDVRKAPIRRFPYALYYRPEPKRIAVVGCFHNSRDPRRLARRL